MSKKLSTERRKSDDENRTPVRRNVDRALDEALEETFPASDPVAVTDPTVEVIKEGKLTQ
ncbi:MAG TPA: hypothetical protein VH558_16030 [Pseudolabrys sp.]|jgi:hypothetical protein